jgi:phage repressor protein C with HTH and peptisase S24 domain
MQKLRFDTFFNRLCDAISITSQANLANTLNISRSAITQAKRNDSIPKKWIVELSRLHNLNPAWLEKGAKPMFSNERSFQEIFFQVPKVRARLSAGGGSFETEQEIEEFYSFRKDWLSKKGKPEDMVLMDIIGNSMEPELKGRDTVLIDQSQKAVLAGAIYAVGLDDTIVVKRLEKRPKELVLHSENASYPQITFRGEEIDSVRIIGKVIWVCRELN